MLPQNKPDRIRILFDDHRLVANAGLLLPATLARHLGLRELVDHHLDLGGAPGRANTGDKMLTLVASALAGGDCIDDADALRAGGTVGIGVGELSVVVHENPCHGSSPFGSCRLPFVTVSAAPLQDTVSACFSSSRLKAHSNIERVWDFSFPFFLGFCGVSAMNSAQENSDCCISGASPL